VRLFHWTCEHGCEQILGALPWMIKPRESTHPLFRLSWFTPLDNLQDVADVEALGLTSQLITCDRTEYRFEISADDLPLIEPWTAHRRQLTRAQRALLEATPGARPQLWYVSDRPVRVADWMRA
jgi:hypothetical protein